MFIKRIGSYFAFVAACVCCLAIAPYAFGLFAPFADVEQNAWYQNDVNIARGEGLLTGYQTDSGMLFGPNDTCTRAQAIVVVSRIAHRLEGSTSSGIDSTNTWVQEPLAITGAHNFADVSENAYYYNALCWAVEQGIMPQANVFHPDDAITRQELAVLLQRLAAYLNKTDVAIDNRSLQLTDYTDGSTVSVDAVDGVSYCLNASILTGYATERGMVLDLARSIKRSELAAMSVRALVALK